MLSVGALNWSGIPVHVDKGNSVLQYAGRTFRLLTSSNLFFLPVKLNKQQPLNDRAHRDPEELEEEGSQSENENSLGPEAAAKTAETEAETLTARPTSQLYCFMVIDNF